MSWEEIYGYQLYKETCFADGDGGYHALASYNASRCHYSASLWWLSTSFSPSLLFEPELLFWMLSRVLQGKEDSGGKTRLRNGMCLVLLRRSWGRWSLQKMYCATSLKSTKCFVHFRLEDHQIFHDLKWWLQTAWKKASGKAAIYMIYMHGARIFLEDVKSRGPARE